MIHRTSNFLSHPATAQLARRGFLVLAMNPRSDNNETIVNVEENALDIRSGIEFLRKQPGITRVLLFGHSGGGAATTLYQAIAEHGPSYCQGRHKIVECMNDLAGLPKADGIVLMDAHPINAVPAGGRGRIRGLPSTTRAKTPLIVPIVSAAVEIEGDRNLALPLLQARSVIV